MAAVNDVGAKAVPGLGLGANERGRLWSAAEWLIRHPYEYWRYADSVAFEGLIAASDLLAEPTFIAHAHGALRAWAVHAEPFTETDDRSPGLAACVIAQRTSDEQLVDLARRLGEFLAKRPTLKGAFISVSKAPLRTPYGDAVLAEEERALLDDPGPAIMLNGLHVNAPFFAALGALLPDEGFSRLAARQALAHLDILLDDDGMLHHFYLERTGRRYGRAWGRGQAWALLGVLQVIMLLGPDAPERPDLVEASRRLAETLRRTQSGDGTWGRTLTDGDDVEASVSAFASAAFSTGVLTGVLDSEFAHLAVSAWESTLRYVDDAGVLSHVSVNVGASTLDSHYAQTPFGEKVTWGQGPLIVAGREIDALLRLSRTSR